MHNQRPRTTGHGRFGHQPSLPDWPQVASVDFDSHRLLFPQVNPQTSVQAGRRFSQEEMEPTVQQSGWLPELRSYRHFQHKPVLVRFRQRQAKSLQCRARPHQPKISGRFWLHGEPSLWDKVFHPPNLTAHPADDQYRSGVMPLSLACQCKGDGLTPSPAGWSTGSLLIILHANARYVL